MMLDAKGAAISRAIAGHALLMAQKEMWPLEHLHWKCPRGQVEIALERAVAAPAYWDKGLDLERERDWQGRFELLGFLLIIDPGVEENDLELWNKGTMLVVVTNLRPFRFSTVTHTPRS